ncbi:sugar porter family MFS transporter [Streptomyces sediminimaris]|uniref:sugar porter family MFS transporter n=1 Tax=Streptomyces sediminimaris TaxID=3383721 RepID=UPI00399A922C
MEFLKELKANALVARTAVIAAIGGFLFGYDTGIISGALLYIKKDFHAGSAAQEFIVSSLLLGAVGGALLSGYLADRISRRNTKIISGTVYLVAALGCALSMNTGMLIGFRALLGLAVGTASFVSPLYISEVSPPRIRGGLTSFNQLATTSGILVAYLINYLFKDFAENWRWMLGVAAVPGAALAIGMFSVPKTPRWLVEQRRDDDARDVLRKLRRGSADDDVDRELDAVRRSVESSRSARARDLLTGRARPLLIVGVGLAFFQQFVGVNTIIYYAPTILQQTGLSADSAVSQALSVGITNVVFTVVAVLLLDKVGRRPLLLTGTALLTVALAGLGVYFAVPALRDSAPWMALVALVLYIAAFAIGLGPVFWLMISEIFPQTLRGTAMSVCTAVNWGANFAISASFLSLAGWISRSGVFWIYTALGVVAWIFFSRRVPETRGKSLEDIQEELGADTEAEREPKAA